MRFTAPSREPRAFMAVISGGCSLPSELTEPDPWEPPHAVARARAASAAVAARVRGRRTVSPFRGWVVPWESVFPGHVHRCGVFAWAPAPGPAAVRTVFRRAAGRPVTVREGAFPEGRTRDLLRRQRSAREAVRRRAVARQPEGVAAVPAQADAGSGGCRSARVVVRAQDRQPAADVEVDQVAD